MENMKVLRQAENEFVKSTAKRHDENSKVVRAAQNARISEPWECCFTSSSHDEYIAIRVSPDEYCLQFEIKLFLNDSFTKSFKY